MDKTPTVYITTNKPNGTLYIGVTSNLSQRIWQHKQRSIDGFSKRYNLDKLVWYEVHNLMDEAIVREKHIKTWKRQWKVDLVEKQNPEWQDLYLGLF